MIKKRFYRPTPNLVSVKDGDVLKNGSAAVGLKGREFASNSTPIWSRAAIIRATDGG